MTYRIKPAQKEQADRVLAIMNQVKTQMKGLNIDQWQKGYPSRKI